MKILKPLNEIFNAENLKEADTALQRIMTRLECEKFSYNYYPTNFQQTNQTRHTLCSNTVDGWQTHYSSQHYDRIDPIFDRMRKSQLPIGWRLENEWSTHGNNQKKLFSDAIEFGFRGGFAVPIHAPFGEFANLVVQDVEILKIISAHPEIEHNLQLIAYHYHAKVSQLLESKPTLLTARELECLQLTADHKTAKEIARIINVTPRTVGFHIENLLKKLNVSTKFQAVSKAKQLGLLR